LKASTRSAHEAATTQAALQSSIAQEEGEGDPPIPHAESCCVAISQSESAGFMVPASTTEPTHLPLTHEIAIVSVDGSQSPSDQQSVLPQATGSPSTKL
jgi:hypothetical protein